MNNLKLWNKSISNIYTYRHDSILNYIVSKIDTSKYSVYSVIVGHQATNGGTIPVTIAVTQL